MRKTIGATKVVIEGDDRDSFDYGPLINPGVTLLKFGRGGAPKERLFKLSADLRFLRWYSGFISSFYKENFSKSVKFELNMYIPLLFPVWFIFLLVDMEKVTRIMQGQNTHQFQRYVRTFTDATEKSFSIVYLTTNNEERTLDVIAPSADVFNLCYGGLSNLLRKLQDQRQNFSLDALYLKAVWDRADTDRNGTLSSSEVLNIVNSINLNIPTVKVKAMYKAFDADNNGSLDFPEFVEFMSLLRKR